MYILISDLGRCAKSFLQGKCQDENLDSICAQSNRPEVVKTGESAHCHRLQLILQELIVPNGSLVWKRGCLLFSKFRTTWPDETEPCESQNAAL